jgi:hypothetical protein
MRKKREIMHNDTAKLICVLVIILIIVIVSIASGSWTRLKQWNDAVNATLSAIKSEDVNYAYKAHSTLTEPGGSPVATDIEYHIDGYAYKIDSPEDGVEYRVYGDGEIISYTYNESSGKYSKSGVSATKEAFLKERNDIADKSGITGIIKLIENKSASFDGKDGEHSIKSEKVDEKFKKEFINILAPLGDAEFFLKGFEVSFKLEDGKFTKITAKLRYRVQGQGTWEREIQWTLGGAVVEIPPDSEIEAA